MPNSVRSHRWQPTRLPRPWDSPGKNTGVGCHFLLQCMQVKSEREVAQSYPTLSDPMDCSLPGSSVHGICQGRVLEWGAIAFSRTLHLGGSNCGLLNIIPESHGCVLASASNIHPHSLKPCLGLLPRDNSPLEPLHRGSAIFSPSADVT